MITNVLSQLKETALHAAVLANSPTILRNMIVQMRIAMETVDMTSVLNHCDNDGKTALHLAASLGYKVRLYILAIACMAAVSFNDNNMYMYVTIHPHL